ncbi:shikimate/quinate 5-dehydrogenase [Klebsiella pneumoniae]|nr:shikimate/quinate 5-dehydrogenase [Klebsiella pneumoniae]
MVSGTTQVVAVIGHPIAQVKSPDNFNRYFAEQHMDSIMIPVDIVPDAVAAYLNALRGWQNMTGVLVTVPHKQRAAALVDDLTPRARRLTQRRQCDPQAGGWPPAGRYAGRRRLSARRRGAGFSAGR